MIAPGSLGSVMVSTLAYVGVDMVIESGSLGSVMISMLAPKY